MASQSSRSAQVLEVSTSDLSEPDTASSPSARSTSDAEPSSPSTGPESPACRTFKKSTARPYNWRLTEQQKQTATVLYDLGHSCGMLAPAFGVSRQSMWDVLRRRTILRGRLEALPRKPGRTRPAKRRANARYRTRAKRITRAQARAVWARDQVCVFCSGPGADIDHMHPVAARGQTTLENLQLLCKPCHIAKTRDERQGKVI